MSKVPRFNFDAIDLNDLVIFARVVQHGSFTAAAKIFGKSPSYMSKHVTYLENALSLALLHRSTHHVFLTEAGSAFFENCQRILAELDAAKANASGLTSGVGGTLRVHSTPGVGHGLVAPAAVAFMAQHASVHVELSVSATSISLTETGVDLVVGSRDFAEDHYFHSGLLVRNLGRMPHVLCASPDYLARHGTPQAPQDLTGHNCLIHTSRKHDRSVWMFDDGSGEELAVPVDGTFRSNLESAVLLAAVQGAGIARLPCYSVVAELRAGRLQTLLEGQVVSDREIKVFYPKSRFVPSKVRAFIDVLATVLGEMR